MLKIPEQDVLRKQDVRLNEKRKKLAWSLSLSLSLTHLTLNFESLYFALKCLFFKMGQPGLFFVYFRSFQANITIFTTNKCEKMAKWPSSIRRRDSNPRPFKHESSPITTRPGLPPMVPIFYLYCANTSGSSNQAAIYGAFRLRQKSFTALALHWGSSTFCCCCC